jgi:hypothetical protein
LIDYSWVTLQESGLGLGSTLVPYISSMLSPSMAVPCFTICTDNTDVG